jgi:hypothetical protein
MSIKLINRIIEQPVFNTKADVKAWVECCLGYTSWQDYIYEDDMPPAYGEVFKFSTRFYAVKGRRDCNGYYKITSVVSMHGKDSYAF